MACYSLAVVLVALAALAAASPLTPCKTTFDESIAVNNADCTAFETLAECLILVVDEGKSRFTDLDAFGTIEYQLTLCRACR